MFVPMFVRVRTPLPHKGQEREVKANTQEEKAIKIWKSSVLFQDAFFGFTFCKSLEKEIQIIIIIIMFIYLIILFSLKGIFYGQ